MGCALPLAIVAALSLLFTACGPAPSSEVTSPAEQSDCGTPAPSEPSTLLGTFDLATWADRFSRDFTTATVEGGKIRYVAQVGQVGFDFMVDPADEAKTILQTSAVVDDVTVSLTQAEETALDDWFDFIDNRQPEAVDWLKGHLNDFTAAPGAEISIRELFGGVEAGFFTLPRYASPELIPPPPGEDPFFHDGAGVFVEDDEAIDRI
jgi:hypothetical protein